MDSWEKFCVESILDWGQERADAGDNLADILPFHHEAPDEAGIGGVRESSCDG